MLLLLPALAVFTFSAIRDSRGDRWFYVVLSVLCTAVFMIYYLAAEKI